MHVVFTNSTLHFRSIRSLELHPTLHQVKDGNTRHDDTRQQLNQDLQKVNLVRGRAVRPPATASASALTVEALKDDAVLKQVFPHFSFRFVYSRSSDVEGDNKDSRCCGASKVEEMKSTEAGRQFVLEVQLYN